MKHLQVLGLCVSVLLGGLVSGCATSIDGTRSVSAPTSPALALCEYKRDGTVSPMRPAPL